MNIKKNELKKFKYRYLQKNNYLNNFRKLIDEDRKKNF